MAYGNPGPAGGSDMMDDAAPAAGPETKPGGEEEKSPSGETTLIPKSMGMGKPFKVGDEIVLKIVAVHDDQFEVEYASEKGAEEESPPEEGGGETPSPAAPPGGGGGMASMMY